MGVNCVVWCTLPENSGRYNMGVNCVVWCTLPEN